MSIIYARFNRHRRPEFQLSTVIIRDGSRRYVLKKALTAAARGHLSNMRAAQALMRARCSDPQVRIPALLDNACGPDTLAFEYIDAPGMDQLLFEAYARRDRKAFLEIVDDYRRLLTGAFQTRRQPELNAQLRGVFGPALAGRLQKLETPCTAPAFIDPVFENVLSAGGQRAFIDNEWVMDGALPTGFAVYRALFYFFDVKHADFPLREFIDFDELLATHGISRTDIDLYREMDEAFQAHVFGAPRCFAYMDRYTKYAHVSVASMEQTIAHQREVVRQLHGQLAAVVDSTGWRMLERMRAIWNRLAPPGSRRRGWINRCRRRN